ncbi:hypothetical protein SSAG_06352 [Streptomyces sp. Mg1]|nr:hypothetical protein SSAG_06352 [Streptomyces sp. Mg1]
MAGAGDERELIMDCRRLGSAPLDLSLKGVGGTTMWAASSKAYTPIRFLGQHLGRPADSQGLGTTARAPTDRAGTNPLLGPG